MIMYSLEAKDFGFRKPIKIENFNKVLTLKAKEIKWFRGRSNFAIENGASAAEIELFFCFYHFLIFASNK